MNHREFAAGMQEITEAFGEKRYPPAIMSRLFSELAPVNGEIFVKLMRELLMTAKGPATAAEIRNACYSELGRAKDRIRREAIAQMEQHGTGCDHCRLSGWIFATSLSPDHLAAEFSFRCGYCNAAATRKIHPDIPTWSPTEHGPKFSLRDFGCSKQRASNSRIQSVLAAVAKTHNVRHWGDDRED